MNNVKSLKARQLTAVKLLALGTPANQVAAQLEVSTMTIYRWKRMPEFEAMVGSIALSGLEEIAKKMNATTLTAVETLQEILCNMNEPVSIRLKAAIGVLKNAASALATDSANFAPKLKTSRSKSIFCATTTFPNMLPTALPTSVSSAKIF